MENKVLEYRNYTRKQKAFRFAMWLISWDSETAAPSNSFTERSKFIGILGKEIYELNTNPRYLELIDELYENLDSLDDLTKLEIKKAKENKDELAKIDPIKLQTYNQLRSASQNIWKTAKKTDNYEMFKDTLSQILDYNIYLSETLATDELKGYDVLLNSFEEGMKAEDYDKFFDTLKRDLVPFAKKVLEKSKVMKPFELPKKFSIERQKEFVSYIEDVMCFDKTRGLSSCAEHPMTSGLAPFDVRYTNHFYEDNILPAIFAAMHELGHATYEQQVNPELFQYSLGGGTTSAMHESQSRFYENMVGRNHKFWEKHYSVLKETFKEELQDVTLDDFYLLINNVQMSFIRIEADELTYPLHIMLRYDIEKMMFNKELTVDEIPAMYNKLMKEYLGLDVDKPSNGVLQDIHWAAGLFGYFPTYALGSAMAAQLYYTMIKELDFDKILQSDNLKEINNWLKEKIHKYGKTKLPKELIKEATGEEFDSKYYVEYLIEKYSKLYNI